MPPAHSFTEGNTLMRDSFSLYTADRNEYQRQQAEKAHAANVAAANAAAQQRRNHQLVTGQLTPQQYGQQHNALSDLGKRHGIDVQGGLRRMATPAPTAPAAPQRQFDLPSVTAREHADLPRRAAAATAVPGSLASGIDARGNRSYDNDSIRRMLARNGDADWQNYGRGSQPQAAAPQGGIARRAPGAVQMGGGPSTAVISANSAEKERQARISELKSEMYKLGSLNSRGKRAMWTAMQNEIGNLTGQRYDADTKRDMQRADHQHSTATTNANLRDRAADRQHRQDQFDASMAWDQQKHGDNMAMGLYERMLQQQAISAKAKSEAKENSAKELREQQKHDREMDAYFNKQAEDRINQLVESGMSRDQATAAYTREMLSIDKDPTLSDAGARGLYNMDAEVRKLFDTESDVVQRARAGDGWSPFTSQNLPAGVTPRLTDYTVERSPGWGSRFAGWLNDNLGTNVGTPEAITYTDADGGIARRYATTEQAKRIREAQAIQREAARRRDADGIQRRGHQ